MDVRPYRQRRIDDLETLFASRRADAWFLDDLLHELRHRNGERAALLARQAVAARRELASSHGDDDQEPPRVVNGEPPTIDLMANPAGRPDQDDVPAAIAPDAAATAEPAGAAIEVSGPDAAIPMAAVPVPPPPQPPAPELGVSEIQRLTRIYDGLREKLLDLTKRNRMLNYPVGPRARQLQIVDEVLEEVHERLVDEDATLRVVALEEPSGTPEDEKSEEFVTALEHARLADVDYQTQLQALIDTGRDDEHALEKLDRDLRDRTRAALHLLPRPQRAEINRAEHARSLGINPNPELEPSATRPSHSDTALQTLKYPDELERTVDRILDEARMAEQEAGLSTLFLSFGFLEWYDSPNSDRPLYAPLLLLPVRIDRKKVRGREVLDMVAREGAAETNVSLERFLHHNHSRLMPAFVQPEGEAEGSIEAYLSAVSAAVAGLPRWKIRRWLVLGNFAFSRVALYEDTRRDRWPNLFSHPLVSALLAGYERDVPSANQFRVPEDYRIDDPDVERHAPILIHDADASQHSALIDVMRAKNLVIEGPPGTGKSQTITNVIANALANGQTVLFLAEKRAALDVVKSRLDAAGLGEFCLELHSDKSSPRAVIDNLRRRYELGIALPDTTRGLQRDPTRDAAREELSDYLGALHAHEADGRTPFELIWKSIRSRASPGSGAAMLEATEISDALLREPARLAELRGKLAIYAETAQTFAASHGHPASSPWALTPPAALAAFDRDPFLSSLRGLRNAGIALFRVIESQRLVGIDDQVAADAMLAADRTLPEPPSPAALKAVDGIDGEALLRVLALHAATLATADTLSLLPAPEIDGETLARATELATKAGPGLAALTPAQLFRRAGDAVSRHRSFVATLAPMRPLLAVLGDGGATSTNRLVTLAEGVVAAGRLRATSRANLGFRDLDGGALAALPARAAAIRDEEATLRAILRDYSEPDWPPLPELDEAAETLRKTGFGRLMGAQKLGRAMMDRLGILATAADPGGTIERVAGHIRARDAFLGDEPVKAMLGPLWAGLDTPFGTVAGVIADAEALRIAMVDHLGGTALAETLLAMTAAQLDALRPFEPIARVFLAAAPAYRNGFDATPFDDAIARREVDIRSIEALLDIDADRTLDGYDISLKVLSEIDAARRIHDTAMDAAKASPLYETALQIAPDQDHVARIQPALDWFAAVRSAGLPEEFRDGLLSPDLRQWREKLHEAARIRGGAEQAMKRARDLVDRYQVANLDDFEISALIAHLDRLHDRAGQLAEFMALKRERDVLDDAGLTDFLARADKIAIEPRDLPALFDATVARLRVNAARRRSDALAHRTGTNLDIRRRAFAERDRLKIGADREIVRTRLLSRRVPDGTRVGPVRGWTEMHLLAREFGKQTKFTPVRGLLARSGRAVRALTPCFMMSPLSLAKFLSPGEFKFDLLVIDEASQMKPEDALGAMLRAKQIVVVGDRQQLPPTSFFDRTAEDRSDDDIDDEIDDESILERCQTVFAEVRRLKWHYRCRSESLIRFSNEKFYNGALITFPASVTPSFAIDIIRVDGTYQASRNLTEAERVAEEAVTFMRRYADVADGAFPTLGIVAINTQQRDLIFDTFSRVIRGDELVERYLARAAERNEPFFVKNLENVQGDERDAIFVSLTYGKAPGANVVAQRFGPINSRHGHRRLNVLFSRARSRLALFASFGSDDVRPAEGANRGVNILKQFLEYAETRGRAEVDAIGGVADSDFEIEVASRLRARGYETEMQVGTSGFRIDLGVRHPDRPGHFMAGIECDGARFHSSRSARDRDRLREEVLRSRGWDILRVWSTDWFDDPDGQTDRLVKKLDELRTRPVISVDDFAVVPPPPPAPVPTEAEATPEPPPPSPATNFGGDGPIGEPEAVALLEAFRDTVIKPASAGWEPQRSILRDAMIETFVRQHIADADEWFTKVPLYQRSGTSPVEKRLYLDRIVSIVGRLRSEP